MNVDELAKRLDKALDDDAKRELLERVMAHVLAASQKRTPVRTGTLRRSLTTRVEVAQLRGVIGTNIVYGPFVHNGTKHMPPRPFLAQGIADAQSAIMRLLTAAGEAILGEVAS